MTKSGSAIRALVFDAYGTLFDVTSVGALCEKKFPGHGKPLTELWRVKQLEYTWLCSLMGRYQDFWELTARGLRFACGALGLALEENTFRDLMENYLRLAPYPEVPEALERLAHRLPLAILSNGSPEMLLQVTRYNQLTPYFKAVLSVHDLGIFKPAPQVYALAERALDLPRHSIGFVSSNGWDAAGAKAFGLNVFWINRFSRYPETLGLEPDWEIRTLLDIEPKLP
ncbi:MAG: haloacid dehalogenase type II [Deltaproteobacteria bacterium]|nr:haloacid dehalogenase type II [Deltaproteobacteria bacterium]